MPDMMPMGNDSYTVRGMSVGLSREQVADYIKQYGHDVVDIVEEAVRNGFSLALVQEVLDKCGPLVLQLIVGTISMKVGAQSVGLGVEAAVLQGLARQVFTMLIARYGDQVIDRLLDMVMKK